MIKANGMMKKHLVGKDFPCICVVSDIMNDVDNDNKSVISADSYQELADKINEDVIKSGRIGQGDITDIIVFDSFDQYKVFRKKGKDLGGVKDNNLLML